MISEATGQTYLIPQRQPLAQPQAAPQAMPTQEPSPWQGQMAQPDQLGQVEGLTNNYYNAYSRLKDFTETMWKDYGLDVTKPDFTQQGGGNLHQAFQAMDADLRLAANDLAQHKKNVENMQKLQAEGKIVYAPGFDPTKQLTSQMQPYQMYTPTDIADDVKLAIQGVSNHVYNTQAEANAAYNTSILPLINQYQKKIETDPNNTAYYQRQIDALRMPTYETKTFSPKVEKGLTQTALLDSFYNDWKYHVNLLNGNVEPGKISGKEYYNNKPYSVVYDIPNLKLGTTTVDNNGKSINVTEQVQKLLIGSDGQVIAFFSDPKANPVVTSNLTADEIGRAVYASNTNYTKPGTYIPAMYEIAKQKGLVDPNSTTGEIPKANFLQEYEGKTQLLKGAEQQMQSALDEVSAKFDSGNDVELTTNKGETIKFKKESFKSFFGDTTYEIDKADYKKLTGKSTIPSNAKIDGLTREELLKLIKDYNTNLDIFNKPAANPTVQSPTSKIDASKY